MAVYVVSKRHNGTQARAGDSIVYIGRPSLLGNPFVVTLADPRKSVIELYRDWLRAEYVKRDAVYDELNALAKRSHAGECIALQCWCAPLECHGDVICEAIAGIIGREHHQC